jgi:hypothetical protein
VIHKCQLNKEDYLKFKGECKWVLALKFCSLIQQMNDAQLAEGKRCLYSTLFSPSLALHDAASKGHLEIISLLIKDLRVDLNAKDNEGKTGKE